MCTGMKHNIRACLLKSWAHREQEETAADFISCVRYHFDGMALQKQRSGGSSKEALVWKRNGMRKAFRFAGSEMKRACKGHAA